MPARAATWLVVTAALPRSLNSSSAALRTRSRVRRAPSVVGILVILRAYTLTEKLAETSRNSIAGARRGPRSLFRLSWSGQDDVGGWPARTAQRVAGGIADTAGHDRVPPGRQHRRHRAGEVAWKAGRTLPVDALGDLA